MSSWIANIIDKIYFLEDGLENIINDINKILKIIKKIFLLLDIIINLIMKNIKIIIKTK